VAKINESERKTQDRVIKLFKEELGYKYYGNLHSQINSNIIVDKLLSFLLKTHSKELARRAVDELEKTTTNFKGNLYETNKDVYTLLKYGVDVSEHAGDHKTTVYFIDWKNLNNNEFAIAEEVTIKDKNTRRPDLVVYINGIAVAVIELKKSTETVSKGIRQNISNQDEHFNQPFFTTIQFVMAGNNSEGLRYGTIGTKEKYFMQWKNETEIITSQPMDKVSLEVLEKCETLPDKLDWQLFSMFYKVRFLDLIHDFIVYDNGIKKVCRHNQYFGVKKAQEKLKRKQGGIIWHTQGSGKTLTMVWLSKWILANMTDARVLIVTDREELDEQIERVFKDVEVKVARTKSGADLLSKLNTRQYNLLCSLIQKFKNRKGIDNSVKGVKKSVDGYIRELKKALLPGFKAKGEFVVFVDECHRTQSGVLHESMRKILPTAIFIGFTGTPLLKADKPTSLEVFSPGYIHTYKYNEAVADGVVLDLLYEARDVNQIIRQHKKIDLYFQKKTRGLNDSAKAKLKAKWGKMQKIYSSRERLQVIAKDIIEDFDLKPRLTEGNGNAMLVSDSIYSACRYYQIFQSLGFKQCAIITSYEAQTANVRTEADDSQEFQKYEIYLEMLGSTTKESFESEAKRKFVEEPAQMKLLIVVDKLLTGFDAPPCTFLYIDKKMQDHGLFQAICRVNRLDGESKQFGYIIDYNKLFPNLIGAMQLYTSGAFKGYDLADIDGMIHDRLHKAEEQLLQTLESLDDLCSGVTAPREELQFLHYFCGESGVGTLDDETFAKNREKLYNLTNKLIRCFAEVNSEINNEHIVDLCIKVKPDVVFYTNLKEIIGKASGDFIDLKCYEQDMRHLIDMYVRSEDSRKIGEFDNLTLLDFVMVHSEKLGGKNKEAVAEVIENNIRRKITERMLTNPKYYEKMSEILDKLIKERREEAISYERWLQECIILTKNTVQPENNPHYPERIMHSSAMRAFYDHFDENEELAIVLHNAVLKSKRDQFRHNRFKEGEIKEALYEILEDDAKVEIAFNIVVEQRDEY